MYYIATQRLRDQFLFPELRAEVHVHGLNAAAKHFKLTSPGAMTNSLPCTRKSLQHLKFGKTNS